MDVSIPGVIVKKDPPQRKKGPLVRERAQSWPSDRLNSLEQEDHQQEHHNRADADAGPAEVTSAVSEESAAAKDQHQQYEQKNGRHDLSPPITASVGGGPCCPLNSA